MSPLPFKVRNAILCEDVREEINGKHVLVGVVSEGFVVREFPAELRIATYLEVQLTSSPGAHEFFVRLGYTAGKAPLLIRAQVLFPKAGTRYAISTPPMQLRAERPGHIVGALSTDRKTWTTYLRRSIAQGEVHSPVSFEPPSSAWKPE